MNEQKMPESPRTMLTRQHQTPRAGGKKGNSTRSSPANLVPRPFSADELRWISADILARNPPRVETTRLGLMEIDPWNVHAYWHIDPADMTACRTRLPENAKNAELVLRFSDISPQLNDAAVSLECFDIKVPEDGNNWYVNLWRAGKRYLAEIGLRAADGTFVPLARSNEVATPRAGPSPDLDFVRAAVRVPSVPQPQLSGPMISSDILLKDLFPQRLPLTDEYPLAIAESFDGALDEPAFPKLKATIREADTVDLPSESASAEKDLAPSGAAGFPVIESDEIDRFRVLARLSMDRGLADASPPQLPQPARHTIAPTDVELFSRPLPIPPMTAASTPTAATAPDADTPACPPAPVALESVLGKTVFSSREHVIDVSASIVIEGQASPGTQLTLFGESVPQQQDGSFRLCLPLESGPDWVALLRHLRSRYHKG